MHATREKELGPLGIKYVQLGSRGIITARYYDVPPGVKPPDWMLSPNYDGPGWRVYSPWRVLVKWGPRRENGVLLPGGVRQQGKWLSSGWDVDAGLSHPDILINVRMSCSHDVVSTIAQHHCSIRQEKV